MNPLPMSVLATLFAAAGALVGVPSMAVLAVYAFHRLTQRDGPAAAATEFGRQPDALLLMLEGMTRALGAAAGVAGVVSQFFMNAVAVVATAGLVLASVCWFTGRGLGAHAPWARLSAGVLLTLVLLPSLLVALSLHGVGRLAGLVLAALCLLALHTVWTGYAAQAARWTGQ